MQAEHCAEATCIPESKMCWSSPYPFTSKICNTLTYIYIGIYIYSASMVYWLVYIGMICKSWFEWTKAVTAQSWSYSSSCVSWVHGCQGKLVKVNCGNLDIRVNFVFWGKGFLSITGSKGMEMVVECQGNAHCSVFPPAFTFISILYFVTNISSNTYNSKLRLHCMQFILTFSLRLK